MGVVPSSLVEDNFVRVCGQIVASASRAGRNPGEVKLVVVTKGHSLDVIRAVIEAGATRLGENYVEEGIEKIVSLREEVDIEWHMVGHIQSRKAKLVSEHFNWIHSVDSEKIAVRLDRFAREKGCTLPVLLECNISGEESKYGFHAETEGSWEKLSSEIAAILQLPNLVVKGLMTMAPYAANAEESRPYFRRLRQFRDRLSIDFPESSWTELSMGMSADFEIAIQEGATMVRIGEAILGPRSYKGG